MKMLVQTGLILSALVAAPLAAQNIPAAAVAVVDSNKAGTDCTACKTAMAQLQQQQQQLQAYRQQLIAPLQTEGAPIQKSIDALNGKAPDAALQAKINAFQQKQANAEQQLQARAQTFERNRNYVLQQIRDRMGPAVSAVQAKRNATVVLDSSSVINFSPAIDVTNDVIVELNRTLPSIITTAPAATQQSPQGR